MEKRVSHARFQRRVCTRFVGVSGVSLSVIAGTGSTDPFRTSITSLFDMDKTTLVSELHSR